MSITAAYQPAPDRDREPGRDEGPARPARYAGAALLIAVLFAGLLIFGYNQLNTWYRPVMLMAKTTSPGSAGLGNASLSGASLSGGEQVTPGAGGSAVQWGMTGFVGRLTVVGPDTGSAEIMLPVTASNCPEVTAKLDVSCGAGGITLKSPATFSWSPAQELSASGQTAAGLQVDPSTGRTARRASSSRPRAASRSCACPRWGQPRSPSPWAGTHTRSRSGASPRAMA